MGQRSLSRDNGTPGQEKFFVPGQRDNGTSRPLETLLVTWEDISVKMRGNLYETWKSEDNLAHENKNIQK